MGEIKARVFISCGQRYGSNEIVIAHRIMDELRRLGFDPYVATEQQSLRDLKSNIFASLENSEYFLFIDFKREQLIFSDGESSFRGSLFCHQELALASYFDLDVLAFREDGVQPDDGISRFIQTNCHSFSDRNSLPEQVVSKIQFIGWRANWRRQLIFERDDGQFEDAETGPAKIPTRWLQIRVRNLDFRKPAFDCNVYLTSLKNLITGENIHLETIEAKWSGYVHPNAVIFPNSSRRFDAFFVEKANPAIGIVWTFADSPTFRPVIRGPGKFALEYQVVSQNFPVVKGKFIAILDPDLQRIALSTISQEDDGR